MKSIAAPAPSNPRVVAIDYLRILCMAGVFLGHGLLPPVQQFAMRYSTATMGVVTFFVISGYVILRVLLYDMESGEPLWKFYVRRFCRIVPAYWVMLGATATLLPWTIRVTPTVVPAVGHAIAALPGMDHFTALHGIRDAARTAHLDMDYSFGLRNPEDYEPRLCAWLYYGNQWYVWNPTGRGHSNRPDGHCWSLCVEEQFYLVAPIVILIAMKLGGRELLWKVICFGAIPLSVASVIYYELWPHPEGAVHIATLPNVLPISLGALAAVLEKKNLRRVMLSAAYGCLLFGFMEATMTVESHSDGQSHPCRVLFAVGIVYAAIYAVEPWLQRTRLSFLRGSWTEYCGRLTYGMYLWHVAAIYWAAQFLPVGWGLSAVEFILTISLSLLSFRLVERPMTRWGRKIAGNRHDHHKPALEPSLEPADDRVMQPA